MLKIPEIPLRCLASAGSRLGWGTEKTQAFLVSEIYLTHTDIFYRVILEVERQ